MSWVDIANTFDRRARARAVQSSDCQDKVLRSKHPPSPVKLNFRLIWFHISNNLSFADSTAFARILGSEHFPVYKIWDLLNPLDLFCRSHWNPRVFLFLLPMLDHLTVFWVIFYILENMLVCKFWQITCFLPPGRHPPLPLEAACGSCRGGRLGTPGSQRPQDVLALTPLVSLETG